MISPPRLSVSDAYKPRNEFKEKKKKLVIPLSSPDITLSATRSIFATYRNRACSHPSYAVKDIAE